MILNLTHFFNNDNTKGIELQMGFLKDVKEKWERIWIPQVPPQQLQRKSEIELERDKQYETKWVWYHTILAVELFACSVLLLWIAIVLTIGLIIM